MEKNRTVIILVLMVGMDQVAYGNSSEIQRYNCDSNGDKPWCIPKDYDFKIHLFKIPRLIFVFVSGIN